MSNSLAKKRRANLSTPPPPPISTSLNPNPNPNSNNQGNSIQKQVTLPQLLSMFEKRLLTLEKVNSEQQARPASTAAVSETVVMVDESIKETLDEFESRFEILAEQINHIKDTLMKLQTFTMDVNKTLMEERFKSDHCNLVIVEELEEEKEEVSFSEFGGAKVNDEE